MSKKLHIGLVTTVMDGREARGTAGVARAWLYRLLQHEGFTFTLIHHEPDDNDIYRRLPTLTIPHLPGLLDRQIVREIWFWIQMRLHRQHFDVIHYLQPRVWPSYLLSTGKKVIVTPHDAGVMLDITDPTPARKWFRLTNRFLHQRMHAVIAVSQYAKSEICDTYHINPARVHVVYNALPTSFERRPHIGSPSFRSPERYILSVGRFDPHKNILRLIEAYAEARKNGITESLVLVGGAHNARYTQEIRNTVRRLNLSDFVIEAPFIPDQELPELYARARALAYPSLHEGFGLPLLEAMAVDTPIACSNRTSLPEIAGDAALFFDPEDIADMAQALTTIVKDETLRKQLITNGQKRLGNFSWEKSVATVVEIYRS